MTEALAGKKSGGKNPLRWLNDNFESIFLVTGLLGMILLITWQVAYRYIITKFTPGASTMVAAAPEELARYLFVWISYLAVPDFRVRGIPQERKQEIQEAAGRVSLPPIDL